MQRNFHNFLWIRKRKCDQVKKLVDVSNGDLVELQQVKKDCTNKAVHDQEKATTEYTTWLMMRLPLILSASNGIIEILEEILHQYPPALDEHSRPKRTTDHLQDGSSYSLVTSSKQHNFSCNVSRDIFSMLLAICIVKQFLFLPSLWWEVSCGSRIYNATE